MTAIEASERSHPIIEFGCGNGRDSIYFATHGFKVYGCDLSKDAIEKDTAKSKDVDVIFKVVDASSNDEVQSLSIRHGVVVTVVRMLQYIHVSSYIQLMKYKNQNSSRHYQMY